MNRNELWMLSPKKQLAGPPQKQQGLLQLGLHIGRNSHTLVTGGDKLKKGEHRRGLGDEPPDLPGPERNKMAVGERKRVVSCKSKGKEL